MNATPASTVYLSHSVIHSYVEHFLYGYFLLVVRVYFPFVPQKGIDVYMMYVVRFVRARVVATESGTNCDINDFIVSFNIKSPDLIIIYRFFVSDTFFFSSSSFHFLSYRLNGHAWCV